MSASPNVVERQKSRYLPFVQSDGIINLYAYFAFREDVYE